MTGSWKLIARIALQGILLLALASAGGMPQQSCSHLSGISDHECATGHGSGTDPAPDEAGALSPEPAAASVRTERVPVTALDCPTRARAMGDDAQPVERVAIRLAATISSPFYISHCAFLC